MSVADRDCLRRFSIPALRVRGVYVHLDESWRAVRGAHDYAPAVRTLLAHGLTATALLAANLKSTGRMSLQLKSSGGVQTLFTECDDEGNVRGIARIAAGFEPEGDIALDSLGDAVLGITLERSSEERYQGLIAVEHAQLADVLAAYFAQSEQLPTRVWLAVGEGRCAGLLLQQVADPEHADSALFDEAAILADTVKPSELLDLDAETLLRRLFAEHDKRIEPAAALRFACSCSRERVGSMFRALGQEEAFAALAGDRAEVSCEFCNRLWVFDRIDLTRLFLGTGSTTPTEPTAH